MSLTEKQRNSIRKLIKSSLENIIQATETRVINILIHEDVETFNEEWDYFKAEILEVEDSLVFEIERELLK